MSSVRYQVAIAVPASRAGTIGLQGPEGAEEERSSVEQTTAVLQQAEQGVSVAGLWRKVRISE
jgi:hypothetical protein